MARVEAGQVNSFLRHKQHLTPFQAGSEALGVVEELVGFTPHRVHPYFSLRAGVAQFEPKDLDRRLYAERAGAIRWLHAG